MHIDDVLVMLAVLGLIPVGALISRFGARRGFFAIPIYWMAAFPCLAAAYLAKHTWQTIDLVMVVLAWVSGALVLLALVHKHFTRTDGLADPE
jgi:hypothetical protein